MPDLAGLEKHDPQCARDKSAHVTHMSPRVTPHALRYLPPEFTVAGMRQPHLVVLAAAIIWSTDAAAGPAAPVPHVTVRVYVGAVPALPLRAALAHAEAALARAGVSLDWRWCDAETVVAACRVPLGDGELAVRFSALPVPAGYAGRLPLGDSLLEGPRHLGVLATIYSDRVQWLARAAGTDAAPLMGHAIAHEIAHLLLGSHRHADGGLMRAVWTREEIEHGKPGDWIFTPADARAIRQHAATLNATKQARGTAESMRAALE